MTMCEKITILYSNFLNDHFCDIVTKFNTLETTIIHKQEKKMRN